MIHRAAHVVILLAFLGAVAVAFLGFMMPIFGWENQARIASFKLSAGLLLGALALLAADWLAHGEG
ncbi:MAG: hypothetical protein ACRDIU_02970 [Actinomycetota bacterium]